MNKKAAQELQKLASDMNANKTRLPVAAERTKAEKGWILKSGLAVKVYRESRVGLGVYEVGKDPVLDVVDESRDVLVATIMPRQDASTGEWDQWNLGIIAEIAEE